VRFNAGDLRIAFFVAVDEELGAYLTERGAELDLDAAALRIPGLPPAPISNVDSAWIEGTGLPRPEWLLADQDHGLGVVDLESGERVDGPESGGPLSIEEREPGYPEGFVSLDLVPTGDDRRLLAVHVPSRSSELAVGLATGDAIPGGQGLHVRDEFRPDPDILAANPAAPTPLVDAVLTALDEVEGRDVVLGNLHGAFIDGGRPVTRGPELDELLARIRAIERVPWDYLGNGCQSRALVVNDFLLAEGIRPSMLFVSGQLATERGGELLEWNFHAASALLVEDPDTGRVELGVIDPPFSDGLLSLADWLSHFVPDNASGPSGSVFKPYLSMDLLPYYQWQPVGYYGLAVDTDLGLSLDEAWSALDSYRDGPAGNTAAGYSGITAAVAHQRRPSWPR
jgi:Glutaminase